MITPEYGWCSIGPILIDNLKAMVAEFRAKIPPEKLVTNHAYMNAIRAISFVENGQQLGSVPPFEPVKHPKPRRHGH